MVISGYAKDGCIEVHIKATFSPDNANPKPSESFDAHQSFVVNNIACLPDAVGCPPT